MRWFGMWVAIGLLTLVTVPALVASAGAAEPTPLWEQTLTEYLGHHWRGELLRYRLTPAAPLPAAVRLEVVDADGKATPVACQLEAVPDVPAARDLYCVLDLPPYQTLTLRLLAGAPPAAVAAPLPLTEDAPTKTLTLGNGVLDIQVPASIADGKGLAAAAIPAPLLRLRHREPQLWAGAGAFSNTGDLQSLTTRVVTRGPVFTDVEVAYRFTAGEYTATLRLIRDQPVVLWRERCRNTNAAARLSWDCAAGQPLKTGVWDYAKWSAFPGRVRGAGLGAAKAFALEFASAPAPIRFEPWVHWGNPDLTTWLEFWTVLPNYGDINYEKPKIKGGAAGELALPSSDEMTVDIVEKLPAKEWAVGVFMGNPLDWNPADGRAYNASLPRFELGKDGQVWVQLPLAAGQRTWGLYLGERTPNANLGAERVGSVANTSACHIKYSETPLDEVKDYVLDYAGDPPETFPHLFLNEAARREYSAALAPTQPHYARIMQTLAAAKTAATKTAKPLLAGAMDWPLAATPPTDFHDEPSIIAALAAPPDDALAPLLQLRALQASQRFAYHFFRHYTGPGMGIAPHNWLSQEYGVSMVDLATRRLTPEQHRRVRARLLFAAYKFASENYYSTRYGFHGLANMTTLVYAMLGQLALLYPNHPQAAAWRRTAEQEIRRELRDWMGPTGGWLEAPHYMTVSMDLIIGFGYGLANAGDASVRDSDALKRTLLFLAKIATPRDPRFGGKRHFPEIGNTYTMENSVLYTFLARLHRARDPAYADGMQWLWYEMGCPLWPGIGGAYPLTAGYREAISDLAPKPERPPAWGSEHFPGSGVLLRAHFPHERESYLYLIQGNMHDHYDSDFGAFHYWGKGRPLCLDWGYQGMMPAWLHNRMEVGGHGAIVAVGMLAATDYLHNRQATWDRQLLMVKDADPLGPTYLVIRDYTTAPAVANWRLWLNTDAHLPATAPLTTMKGRDDVDLDLWFDAASAKLLERVRQPKDETAPAVPAGGAGAADLGPKGGEGMPDLGDDQRPWVYATTEHGEPIFINQGAQYWGDKNGVKQRGLCLAVPAKQPVLAVLYPRVNAEQQPTITALDGGAGVQVVSPAGTDWVFVGLEPLTAAVKTAAGALTFAGTVGVVQERPGATTLALPAAGSLTVGAYGLAAKTASLLRVTKDTLVVELPVPPVIPGVSPVVAAATVGAPAPDAATEVTLTAPPGFALVPAPGVTLATPAPGTYLLTLPASMTSVTLRR